MTNTEMIERIKKTIDQYYRFSNQQYVRDNQLHFIGGVLQTALHLLPLDQYDDIKKYIYNTWGYDPGGVTDGQMNISEWRAKYDD